MKLKYITCISDLYYVIGKWFTIIMLILAFITLPFSLEKVNNVFSFLMCASIAFVGCAAHYKDKFNYPVHYIAACISAISSIIFTIHIQPAYLIILLLCFISFFDKKRWLLWCEIPFFLMIYLCFI